MFYLYRLSVSCMNVILDVLQSPFCHHATHQRQLHPFTAIHKSSPVTSWDSKVSICTLLNPLFVHSAVNSDIGYLLCNFFSPTTVYCIAYREECDFRCSPSTLAVIL